MKFHVIKILGTGCRNCNRLEENTRKAIKEIQFDTKIEHITDFKEIAKYGVMSTPALVLDDKVLFSGKVLKSEDIKKLLMIEK